MGFHGYDHWKTTEPHYDEDPEYRTPEEEEEAARAEAEAEAEPVVEEVWDPAAGEYVSQVTFADGTRFTIAQAKAGAYVGDYEIHGRGFFSDGFSSPQRAVEWLINLRGW